MPAESIKQKLIELHNSLEKIEQPDQEMVSLLRQLDGDIRSALENEDSSIASPLMSRVRSIGATFAADHPHLDSILHELADMLGKMGI